MFHQMRHMLAKQILATAPKLTRHSLVFIPKKCKLEAIGKLLNLGLTQQLNHGELDFLVNKWVGIAVLDIGLQFAISLEQQNGPKHASALRLIVREGGQADVTFSGNVPELLLIASGKEDPDSLFFQRKLLIEGDTELGLEVKNLLLAIEFSALPSSLSLSITKLTQCLERLQSHSLAPQ